MNNDIILEICIAGLNCRAGYATVYTCNQNIYKVALKCKSFTDLRQYIKRRCMHAYRFSERKRVVLLDSLCLGRGLEKGHSSTRGFNNNVVIGLILKCGKS